MFRTRSTGRPVLIVIAMAVAFAALTWIASRSGELAIYLAIGGALLVTPASLLARLLLPNAARRR